MPLSFTNLFIVLVKAFHSLSNALKKLVYYN